VRYRFIREHQARWPVSVQCSVLDVSRSGYYRWRSCPESETRQVNRLLSREIAEIHRDSRSTYGSPRVYRELRRRGKTVGRHRVARLMREDGLKARTKRRFKATTDSRHAHPVAPDRLHRDFTPEGPNRVWASDITYIWTLEGWLYLAVIMDLYSRGIVGWSMSERLTSPLVRDALQMALQQRRPAAGLLHHSDRGSQYAAGDYQELLTKNGIVCSMSRRGNCWDNAPVESFFSTLKREWVFHQRYRSRAEARQSIFDYIERFYNRHRIHTSIGDQSPMECEQQLEAFTPVH
jgi:transposase InsO family protein